MLSTPLSGWHACGGERGPGVALLLAIARAFAADPARLPNVGTLVLFGDSAHELGDLGAERSLLVTASRLQLKEEERAASRAEASAGGAAANLSKDSFLDILRRGNAPPSKGRPGASAAFKVTAPGGAGRAAATTSIARSARCLIWATPIGNS